MYRYPLIVILYVILSQAAAQSPASHHRVPTITAFNLQADSTIYSALQQLVNAGQPVSYLGFVAVTPIERPLPLRFGEGANGYILEGVTDLSFLLLEGRRGNKHWQQTSRLSFRYAPGVRMTRDNSSNVIPTNQKVGFVVDKVLWDNFTGAFFTESRGNTYDWERRSFFGERKTLQTVSVSLVAMHYSNGQPTGTYASVSDSLIGRNDYIKGDFSTNVLQASLTYHRLSVYGNLLSVNVGYQDDGNWFGPFSYLEAQDKRYGYSRITGYAQWITRPHRNPFGHEVDVFGRDGRTYRIDPKWEYRLRFEYEYILGDLSLFNRSQDYRFNWHLYLEGRPLRSRSLGYLIHVYRGRDYFNIRYDDVVWVFSGGISFTINRYLNPRFHPDKAILNASNTEPLFYQKQMEKQQKRKGN